MNLYLAVVFKRPKSRASKSMPFWSVLRKKQKDNKSETDKERDRFFRQIGEFRRIRRR